MYSSNVVGETILDSFSPFQRYTLERIKRPAYFAPWSKIYSPRNDGGQISRAFETRKNRSLVMQPRVASESLETEVNGHSSIFEQRNK